jgi:hypothetical protein
MNSLSEKQGAATPNSREFFLSKHFYLDDRIVTGKLMIDRFTFQQYVDEVRKQKEQAELDF